MQITEVRIKLMDEPGERLKAFCSITFDNCFVVRDLKIIDGANGPFVAMPSRKLTSHCPRCGMKNHLRAQYCNQCGSKLAADRMPLDADGRAKLYADIAHPINSSCREMIQDRVIGEYDHELELAKQPGYISRYDDFDSDYSGEFRRSESSTPSDERRIDAAHEHPHPPAGVDRRQSADAPPSGGGSSSAGPVSRNERDKNLGGGFGAGIFGDE